MLVIKHYASQLDCISIFHSQLLIYTALQCQLLVPLNAEENNDFMHLQTC